MFEIIGEIKIRSSRHPLGPFGTIGPRLGPGPVPDVRKKRDFDQDIGRWNTSAVKDDFLMIAALERNRDHANS